MSCVYFFYLIVRYFFWFHFACTQDPEAAPKIEPVRKISFLERIRLERLAKEKTRMPSDPSTTAEPEIPVTFPPIDRGFGHY